MDSVSRFRQAREMVSENHERLVDAREDVLVEREAVRSKAKLVRAQRIRAGDSEALFMNQFREAFADLESSFPPILAAAYKKVIEERDALGSIEADYLQVEEDLGAHEWTLTEKETDFYQYGLQEILSDDLLNSLHHAQDLQSQPESSHAPKITPSSSSEYLTALAERERLLQEFDALRPKQAQLIKDRSKSQRSQAPGSWEDPQDTAFVHQYSELLTKIMECEVDIQRLRSRTLASPANRRNSDHVQSIGTPSHIDLISRSQSDRALPTLLESTSVTHRTRTWLLDYLKSNALEKTQYLNILKHTLNSSDISSLDLKSWEYSASRHWNSDMTEQIPPVQNNSYTPTHVTSQQPISPQSSSPVVLSDPATMHPGKQTSKDSPNSGMELGSTPLLSDMDSQWNKKQTGVMPLPFAILPPASKSPAIEMDTQSLESLGAAHPRDVSPGIVPSTDSFFIPASGENHFQNIYQPEQIYPDNNHNYLGPLFSPGYDSAQESDAGECQRLNNKFSSKSEPLRLQQISDGQDKNSERVVSHLKLGNASSEYSVSPVPEKNPPESLKL